MGVARGRLRWLGRVLVGVRRRELLVVRAGLVLASRPVQRVLLVVRAELVLTARLELVRRVLAVRLMVGMLARAVDRRRAMRAEAVRRRELLVARRRVDRLTLPGLVLVVLARAAVLGLVRRVGRPRRVATGEPARRVLRLVELGVGVRRLRVLVRVVGIGLGLGLMSPALLLR